ncbi:MAG: PQQ-binding-like beta-propeller repeat protein [Armatimonadetes bacterium]|nr:PQQ-binding-like beta-propeller repeat protein [Armatimonadota bacterium]
MDSTFWALTSALLLSLLLAQPAPAANDWPVYRHDLRLTGVTEAPGRITAPQVLWEHYLGAPYVPIATSRPPENPYEADLDGDGTPERFSLSGQTITVTDLQGQTLWTHTVEGRPLGGQVRVAKLFPDQPGLQIISFSARMDTGQGQGYCFSFDQGVTKGRLAWTTGPLESQHSPTLVVDDVDGDGLPEIVNAPHYRLQIFNGQTGEVKAEVPWDVGRNYGVLLTRPRGEGQPKDIYIVCDFVLHVDRLALVDGQWKHVWGHKYFDPANPRPGARQKYLRVGPNPVTDLDADGRDEMIYMLVDADTDDQWHLRVRDAQTGEVEGDIPRIWLWSVTDLDSDGRPELVYTPTDQKRPPTACDLHVARYAGGALEDLDVLRAVRPLLTTVKLPLTADSIADEGLQDLLQPDLNGDGRPEVMVLSSPALQPGDKGPGGGVSSELRAYQLAAGKLTETFGFSRPGHRLNVIYAGPTLAGPLVRLRDLTAGQVLEVSPAGEVLSEADLGRPAGHATTPIVVDVDGDGVNEIVTQTAAGEITALKPRLGTTEPPQVLWSRPGVAMNTAPGYTPNGALSPQAADLDGDGRPEIVFAAEDTQGRASVVCVAGDGSLRWQTPIPGCPWGGLQAGVNLWTFGRFAGRQRGLDVYVDIHRRAKGSSEGWVLRGDTGEVLWQRESLASPETTMPFGNCLPPVADVDGDGTDELFMAGWVIYAAVSGRNGEPLFPPVTLNSAAVFGQWIAYSWPTVADLDGDGALDVYLNSSSYARGGYAAVHADGRPLWVEFHDNEQGSPSFGPVGDFDGDGRLEIGVPVLNGTLLCLNAADGSHKWRINASVSHDVVAADINGDDVFELILCQPDGTLRAVSGKDGSDVWSVKLSAPGHPVIADVNGDGLVEVVVSGYDGMLRVVGQGG